jgi:hypothetical protein
MQVASRLRRWLGKHDEIPPNAVSGAAAEPRLKDFQHHYIDQPPSAQNIIEIFQTEWTSKMPPTSGLMTQPGQMALFEDPRVLWADSQLGPIAGMNVLELGPLEGAHSYMFERLGARSVTAIENNTRSFLKCLCVKEIFDLRNTRFLLGNFIPYLAKCERKDLIFASGVLYHMVEPLNLLKLLCEKTDRIFLWTHYYDQAVIANRPDSELFSPLENLDGGSYRGGKRIYPESALEWQGFTGGSAQYTIWLERETLLKYLEDAGFALSLAFDQPDHPNGPALAICASRLARSLLDGE